MLASVNARNHGAYYRTRAAGACFGGWGLQTMLHLWPRIRLIQEEREVLGIDRARPTLHRLTGFAAILPETGPASGTIPALALRACGDARRSAHQSPSGAEWERRRKCACSAVPCLQPNLERYPGPRPAETARGRSRLKLRGYRLRALLMPRQSRSPAAGTLSGTTASSEASLGAELSGSLPMAGLAGHRPLCARRFAPASVQPGPIVRGC